MSGIGLSANRIFLLLFCFGLGLFYLYDHQMRLLPELVDEGITQAYHLSPKAYGYLHTFYYLAYLPLQLLAGFLVDRYTLTRIMTFALLLAAAGCCLFANAHWFWLAACGRMLMGAGAAFIFAGILKTISVRFSEKHFGFFVGSVIFCGMVGVLTLDILITAGLNYGGWRLMCYLLAFAGLLLVAINYCYTVKPQKTIGQDDFRQLLHYLKDRRLLLQSLIAALLYMPVICFAEAWGGRFLLHSYQLSLWVKTLDAGMLFVGFAIGAPVLGWLHDKTGEYQMVLMGSAVAETILLAIVLYVPVLSAVKIGITLLLLGFFTASIVVVIAMNRRLAPLQHAGKIFGITNFFMMLSAISISLVGVLLQRLTAGFIHHFFPFYSVSTYQVALLLLPCSAMFAVFLTLYVGEGLGVSTVSDKA